MVRVGVVGCAHGQFDAIYAHIDEVNAAAACDGDAPVELLLCCGDLQSLRNKTDLQCEACPPRYRRMNVFHQYYGGKKRASVLTIVIGGNHEASNFLQELHYGGWIAPNIFYLGAAGVVNALGLRIAGLSGIYDPKHYKLGHYERAPYTKAALYSVFHVRETEVYQLSHLTWPVDIMLSHDWPRKIENYGDKAALFEKKPHFKDSVDTNSFGSPGGETLLHTLQPNYWFAGHMHTRFEATVVHEVSPGSPEKTTAFVGLDKCLPKRPWLEVIEIQPSSKTIDVGQGDPRVYMDIEWLAILHATHHLMARLPQPVRFPTERVKIQESDLAWVQSRLADQTQKTDQEKIEWLSDFQVTAPSLEDEDEYWTDAAIGNPQTDRLLGALGLPHVVTIPFSRNDGDDDSDADDIQEF